MSENTTGNTTGNTCANCAHVGTYKRPKIIDATGFDDQLMWEDEDKDKTVYMCKGPSSCEHADTERLVPITCDSWREQVKSSAEELGELDRMIAAREARIAAREAREGKKDV